MLARRHELPPLKEPAYEMDDVPRGNKADAYAASVVRRVTERAEWTGALAELVLLTNRAAKEHELQCARTNAVVIHGGKPLGLEYMADRADTDDPLWGYTMRTRAEGWLQGFVTVTTFTTWQRWFRWDSMSEEAGVVPFDTNRADDATSRWWEERVVDADGSLARALSMQVFDGDPDAEGVIWPHTAEISLLGGVGCGGVLLDAVLEELSQPDSGYDFVVVQATENAVPFYESKGFIRVGAVARYERKPQLPGAGAAAAGAGGGTSSSSSSRSHNSHKKKSHRKKAAEESGEAAGGRASSSSAASASASAAAAAAAAAAGLPPPPPPPPREPRPVCSATEYVTTVKGDTPESIARKRKIRVSDVLFLNRRAFGRSLRESSVFIPGTRVRVPAAAVHDFVAPPTKTGRGKVDVKDPLRCKVSELRVMTRNDAKPGHTSSNGMWYTCVRGDTPRKLSRVLGVSVETLVNFNKTRYEELDANSVLLDGTELLIADADLNLKLLYDELKVRGRDDEIRAYEEDRKGAQNRALRAAEAEEGQLELTPVMAYRHWTFADDPVETQAASYMMAMPLNHRINRGALKTLADRLVEEDPPVWDYTPPHPGRALSLAKAASAGEEEQAAGVGAEAPAPDAAAGAGAGSSSSTPPSSASAVAPATAAVDKAPAEDGHVRRDEPPPPPPSAGSAAAAAPSNDPNGAPPPPPPPPPPDSDAVVSLRRRSRGAGTAASSAHGAAAGAGAGAATSAASASASSAPPAADAPGDSSWGRPLREPAAIRVSVLHPSIKRWRQGPLADGRVFVTGSARSAPMAAVITRELRPQLPTRPRPPLSSFFEFCRDKRAELASLKESTASSDFNKLMSEAWNAAPEEVKKKYSDIYEASLKRYHEEKAEFEAKLAQFQREHPDYFRKIKLARTTSDEAQQPRRLFNKVLRIKSKPNAEQRRAWLASLGSAAPSPPNEPTPEERYKYFFVMTFIPDLNWCQVAPIVPDGVFPPSTKKKAEKATGRVRWKLAPEDVAREFDVSASRCVVVKATTMRGCEDADQEEWLIEDSGNLADALEDDDAGALAYAAHGEAF